jgi:alginate O-acetyltransferase complex protein AlgI
LIGVSTVPLGLALPLGISFFTFKTLSYTIDVYRGVIPAYRSAWRYALYVSFFPELVAGPIVRASVFLPQLGRSLAPSWDRAARGARLILLGFSKKLLIANRLAIYVDPVFGAPADYSAGTVLGVVIAYSLQIYCDFSGYSDIAIGVAQIIGFDLPENFNMPYAARSITEFWRRWHITLSEWLRDYLYIPLGGNRRGRVRMYVNLMITMLLGGLWHGASWTFVVWGGLHGAALVVHKRFARTSPPVSELVRRLRTVVQWATTYAFVCLCWIFFRADSLGSAIYILRKLAGFAPGGASWMYLPFFLLIPVIVAAHVIGLTTSMPMIAKPAETSFFRHFGGFVAGFRGFVAGEDRGAGLVRMNVGFVSALLLTAWLVTLLLFAPMRTSPFIYFQF